MILHQPPAVAADGWLAGYECDVVRAFGPGRWARILARLRSHALDRELAAGADPTATPQLSARAASLATRSARNGVADGLERLAGTLGEGPSRRRVLPSPAAVRENAAELQLLARRLRGPAPVYARGVALLRTLLTDGTGPAYADRDGRRLAAELRAARTAAGDV